MVRELQNASVQIHHTPTKYDRRVVMWLVGSSPKFYGMMPCTVHGVLTDPHLLRHISTFKYGWPQALHDFWLANSSNDDKLEDKEYIRRRLMELLLSSGSVELADKLLQCGLRDRYGDICYDVNVSSIAALEHSRLDMLAWALPRSTTSIYYMWQTIFGQPPNDAALLDLVYKAHTTASLEEVTNRVDSINYEHTNAHVLVKWLSRTHPKLALASNIMDKAAGYGNLALVQCLHEQRPEIHCSTSAFSWAVASTHDDVLEFLLTHRRHELSDDVIDQWIQYAKSRYSHVLTLIIRLGLHDLLRGHENALVEAMWYRREGVVDWFIQNEILRPGSVSIDRLASWSQLEAIQKLHGAGVACATTAAIDNAAVHRHWSVVRFLLANRSEGFTDRAVLAATEFHRADVVRLLQQHAHLNQSLVADSGKKGDAVAELPARNQVVGSFIVCLNVDTTDTQIAAKAAEDGRVGVLQRMVAAGMTVVTSTVIQKALEHQKTHVVDFLYQLQPDAFNADMLHSVLLYEFFDLWTTLSAQYAEQAEAVVPDVMSRAASEYRLPVLRYVVHVLGRQDLAQRTIDAALALDNHQYTMAVRLVVQAAAACEVPVTSEKAVDPMLVDPRTPSWAVRIFFQGSSEDDKCERLEDSRWAVHAIYHRAMPFLQLLHEANRYNFVGARAAAIRVGDLQTLQWLVETSAVPLEPSLLDEAIFYHQREIAEWLATHHPAACQEFAQEEKPIVLCCPCGFDLDLLAWIEATPVVKQYVDMGALACYAVQLGDLASVQHMHESYPTELMGQKDLLKWSSEEHMDVLAFLQARGYYPSSVATNPSSVEDLSYY